MGYDGIFRVYRGVNYARIKDQVAAAKIDWSEMKKILPDRVSWEAEGNIGQLGLALENDGRLRIHVWDGSAIYVTDPTDSLVDEEHIPWTKIEYHIDKAITAPKGPPKSSSQMTAVNESDTPQETTLHLHYSTNTTTGWKHSAGIKLGAKVEVKGGMPMIGASKVELSVEVSYSFEWNQSITTTDAATIDLKVSVPARKAIMGEVTWRESSLIVPFTMRGIGTFASGAKASISFDGVYDGVASWNVRSKWVQVESGGEANARAMLAEMPGTPVP
jgi:hypothetical protein